MFLNMFCQHDQWIQGLVLVGLLEINSKESLSRKHQISSCNRRQKRKQLQKKCSETGKSEWLSKVCNVACKSFVIFTTHLSGKEHAAQWALKQNLELFSEPENMAAAPSDCHEKHVEMTNKVVEAGVEASSHCGSSSVVKKQAEALLDAGNIEEIVQDNDLQSRDAQELIKCLEKENKELMETITTSGRSGREFWQDFKERLDRDGVAPLSVDHIFSELRRDFRVPKEVRECFDAILMKLEPTQNETVIEKLEGMLKQRLQIKSSEPEDAPAGPTEKLEEDMNKKKKKKNKKKKKSTLIEVKGEPYVCSICSVICDSPAVLESHLQGRKHAATIKKHTEGLLDDKQIQGEIIQDNGHPRDMIEEFRIKPGEAPENIDHLDKQRKEMRERCSTSEWSVGELFQTFEEVPENVYNVPPKAERIFTEHPELWGFKAAREWIDAIFETPELSQDAISIREFESIANQSLEMSSGDPESYSAGATEHPEEYMDMKKKDKMTKDKAEPEAYVCSICSVICVCPIVFESHLMGRRHAARVKKHAEVLFDGKKILEESLKEKDHPRDALEELRSQPKDAQESIKEVIQSTKERVDNESEHIPSAESSEPKEAREQLASIVKILQFSLEDTSKQTLVEAGNAYERVVETRKENGASATQIRVCGWCNVMCTSQMDFDSHLTGKKHAATLKKHVPVVKQAGTKFAYVKKNGP